MGGGEERDEKGGKNARREEGRRKAGPVLVCVCVCVSYVRGRRRKVTVSEYKVQEGRLYYLGSTKSLAIAQNDGVLQKKMHEEEHTVLPGTTN